MVPDFALSLSFEGISLLRRVGAGWVRVSDVALSVPDLDDAMAQLKTRALGLDPKGDKVMLIIPNEQIRYLDLPDLGGDAVSRETAVKAALDGATPYAVSDLAFDFCTDGGRLKIAAVARETMAEAESFASQHGFAPVSFAAKAPQDAFDGPVWFGPAALFGKRKTQRPKGAIVILEADDVSAKVFEPSKPADPIPEEEAAFASPIEEDTQTPPLAAEPVAPPDTQAAPAPSVTDAPKPADDRPKAPVAAPALSDAVVKPAPVAEPAPAAQDNLPDAPETSAVATAPANDPASDKKPVTDPEPKASLGVSAPSDPSVPNPPEQSVPKPPEQSVPNPPEQSVSNPPEQSADSSAARAALQATPPQPVAPDAVVPPAQDSESSLAPTFSSARRAKAENRAPQRVPPGNNGPIRPRFTPIPPPQINKPKIDAPATPHAEEPNTDGKSIAAGAAAFATRFLSRRAKPDPKPAPTDKIAKGAITAAELDAPKPKAPAITAPDTPAITAPDTPKISAKETPKPDLPAPEKAAKPNAPPLRAKPTAGPSKPLNAPDARAPARPTAPIVAAKSAPKGETLAPKPDPLVATDTPEQPDASPKTGRSALGRMAALAPRRKAKDPAKAKAKPAPAPEDTVPEPVIPVKTSDEERDRMTVFGARQNAPVGGKPRFLGLMLTSGLLLFLVGVAAWASVFLDNGFASLFRSEPRDQVVVEAPAPQDADQAIALVDPATIAPTEPAAPADSVPALDTNLTGADPAPQDTQTEDPVEIAALDTGAATDTAPRTALSQPVVPRTLTPQEAAATYAATGIWQRTPIAPMTPPVDGVDDIYRASIDPDVQQFDAIAMPSARTVAPEDPLADPGLPPPSDLKFDFDARGLVRATPEGALSPEGLRVFTGPPPVLPPRRDAALTPPNTATDAVPDVAPAIPRLRPTARPDNLVEQRERATLGGVSLQELSRIRPVLRPRTAQDVVQEAEPDSPATDQAVARSLLPLNRPRNINAIVRRAERQATTRPAQPVQTAAVAPRTVRPSVPSTNSVARSATVRNALNLAKVSLIGVYGTSSNRRAIVRLPNGNYKNVKPGDRLDGGRVTGIGNGDLRYTKGGRTVTLKMPRG